MTITLAVMTLHGTPQPMYRLKLSGHHRDVITVNRNLRDDDKRVMEVTLSAVSPPAWP